MASAQGSTALSLFIVCTVSCFAGAAAHAVTSPQSNESFKSITRAPTATPTPVEEISIIDENGHLVDTTGRAPQSVGKVAKAAAKGEPEASAATPTPTPTPAAPVAPAAEASAPPAAEAKPDIKLTVKPGKSKNIEAVTAEQSLRWLSNGNLRFVKKNFRADGRSAADRERLVGGQKPHAIVIACSDSRVPPELVFDQALGEIAVIRVAGEALDNSVIASVEEILQTLEPKLLVVLGHTKCATVEAAMAAKEGTSLGSEFLDKVAAEIKPHLKSLTSDKPSAGLEVESALNADGVARDLVKRSDLIRRKVESGELLIKSALYRLDSGKVSFY